MNQRFRMGLPWQLPFYRPLNGFHPLVASFIEGNLCFQNVVLEASSAPQPSSTDAAVVKLASQMRQLDAQDTAVYVEWSRVLEQLSIEAQADRFDGLFLHTAPIYCGAQPWIFHFESFPSLFMPFMFTGQTSGIELQRQPWFELVKAALASPSCERIFTHMHSSRTICDRVFGSSVISAKLHHVPLGIACLADNVALSKFERIGPVRVLFTNSLHQDPRSFYLRGGHHLLRAFSKLRREGHNLALTILSSVPDDLARHVRLADLDGVTWLDKRVDDATLDGLFLDHHLFALPAAGLHSHSLLRALSHGCVPIVSDALGYDEYLDGIDGSVFRVRGVFDQVYRRNAEGWISDDYTSFVDPSPAYAQQIEQALTGHAGLTDLRDKAARNLAHCRRHFDLGASQRAFMQMLLGEPQQRPGAARNAPAPSLVA